MSGGKLVERPVWAFLKWARSSRLVPGQEPGSGPGLSLLQDSERLRAMPPGAIQRR